MRKSDVRTILSRHWTFVFVQETLRPMLLADKEQSVRHGASSAWVYWLAIQCHWHTLDLWDCHYPLRLLWGKSRCPISSQPHGRKKPVSTLILGASPGSSYPVSQAGRLDRQGMITLFLQSAGTRPDLHILVKSVCKPWLIGLCRSISGAIPFSPAIRPLLSFVSSTDSTSTSGRAPKTRPCSWIQGSVGGKLSMELKCSRHLWSI